MFKQIFVWPLVTVLIFQASLLADAEKVRKMVYPTIRVTESERVTGTATLISTEYIEGKIIINENGEEFLEPDKYIAHALTAAHMVSDNSQFGWRDEIYFEIPNWDKRGRNLSYITVIGKVVEFCKDLDFAIVEIEVEPTSTMGIWTTAHCGTFAKLGLFDTIYAVGATLGEPVWVTKGLLSCLDIQYDENKLGGFFGYSANGAYGSSGGGIYNTKGELIGVTLAIHTVYNAPLVHMMIGMSLDRIHQKLGKEKTTKYFKLDKS